MAQPGELVGQRYRLIEPFASGGMGTVWRARHLELDIDVALKLLSADAKDPSALRRFRHEARAAARLRNPNIVQVLDFGVHEQQPYLAMELLRGEDLARRIERAGPLSVEEARHVMDGLARAIQLAHEEGIVHRDLKPANVFLERVRDQQVVKVLDFGIAKDTRLQPDLAKTTSGSLVGSPAYMSPEQALGSTVGPEVDLWAMGVVAFEMITGLNPFEDDTLAKIFERILRDPIPSACQIRPDLPRELNPFFTRALARDPCERFACPLAIAEAFRAATSSVPSLAPVTSRPPLSERPVASLVLPPHGSGVRPNERESAHAQSTKGRRNAALALGAMLLAGATFWLWLWAGHVGPAANDRAPAIDTVHGSALSSTDPTLDVPKSDDTQSSMQPNAAASVIDAQPHASTSSNRSAATENTDAVARPKPKKAPSAQHSAPVSAPPAPSGRSLDPRFGIPVAP